MALGNFKGNPQLGEISVSHPLGTDTNGVASKFSPPLPTFPDFFSFPSVRPPMERVIGNLVLLLSLSSVRNYIVRDSQGFRHEKGFLSPLSAVVCSCRSHYMENVSMTRLAEPGPQDGSVGYFDYF